MSHETLDAEFAGFIRRIRAGDDRAAEELVRRYEPLIRLEARMRLTDPGLHRLFDSMDVCQSVLGSFFLRAAAGQYELDNPRRLLKLLVAMTQNKVALQARRHHAQRRDQRRTQSVDPGAANLVASGPSPSAVASGRELLEAFRQRLTDEERQVADLRAQSCPWGEIASRLGGTAEARRKQLERAVDRVTAELGLDED
jgi:RNA polymerase sigma-70 factor (ECF subfamily)